MPTVSKKTQVLVFGGLRHTLDGDQHVLGDQWAFVPERALLGKNTMYRITGPNDWGPRYDHQ